MTMDSRTRWLVLIVLCLVLLPAGRGQGFTLTLKQNGKTGTFAGKVKPSYGGGTLSGSFTC